MKKIKILEASIKQLKEHYRKTESTRFEFDKIRPNYYEIKFGNKEPMMEHYRQWLIKQGFIYIAILSKEKQECIICGGGHHYYNCPNDSVENGGYINLTNSDMRLLLEVVKKETSIEYKRLHKKLLDISLME